MITDQFCIFFDNEAVAASGISAAVNVSPFAGRDEPVNVTMIINGANAAAVTLTANIQESDDKTNWESLGTVPVTKPDALAVVKTFILPRETKKKFVRVIYSVSATTTGLTFWAGITRDHFAPYAPGQYIDAGKVVA